VYYAELSKCNGSVQYGFRPVLIVQNNIGNKYAPTTIVAPLTTQIYKKLMPTHVFLSARDCGLKRDSVVQMEQMRTISKEDLRDYITTVGGTKMREVDRAAMISIGLAG